MTSPSIRIRGDEVSASATREHSRRGRRLGYLVAVLIDGVILALVNVYPGWAAVPFLGGAFPEVLGLLNVSLVAAIAFNVVRLMADPAWFVAAGDAVMAVITLMVGLALLRVFPFDYASHTDAWELVTRIVLWIVVVGSVIAFLVSCGRLLRALVEPHPIVR